MPLEMSSSRPRSRVGVMGGTFDPIHHGHLVAASEVAARFALDEVVFVPTGTPWQKSERRVAAAEDRYLMTVIATASNPQFSVSRMEVDRPGPTYTIDTLRQLQQERAPGVELFFITGADALGQILTWHAASELFSLAHFIGVTRPGHQLADPGFPDGGVSLVEIPAMAISSTNCRGRVEHGLPIWYLVPDGVVQYISKTGCYARQGAHRDPPAQGLASAQSRGTLEGSPPKSVPHSVLHSAPDSVPAPDFVPASDPVPDPDPSRL